MNQDLGITIATTLSRDDIQSNRTFNYTCVVDLRRTMNEQALPIEERALKRMKNFQIKYEQKPMNLARPSERQESELYRIICEQRESVLVLTDDPVALADFCMSRNIRFGSKELFLVETGSDTIPVGIRQEEIATPQVGTIAS